MSFTDENGRQKSRMCRCEVGFMVFGILALLEFSIYGGQLLPCTPSTLPVSDTLQSSTYEGSVLQQLLAFLLGQKSLFSAKNGVDGKKISDVSSGTCAQTKSEMYPWWQAQLGEKYYVTSVIMTTPQSCDSCHFKLENILVEIGAVSVDYNTAEWNIDWNAGKQNCTFLSTGTEELSVVVNCSKPLLGNFVRLSKLNTDETTLSLCEVEIFGFLNCTYSETDLPVPSTVTPTTSINTLVPISSQSFRGLDTANTADTSTTSKSVTIQPSYSSVLSSESRTDGFSQEQGFVGIHTSTMTSNILYSSSLSSTTLFSSLPTTKVSSSLPLTTAPSSLPSTTVSSCISTNMLSSSMPTTMVSSSVFSTTMSSSLLTTKVSSSLYSAIVFSSKPTTTVLFNWSTTSLYSSLFSTPESSSMPTTSVSSSLPLTTDSSSLSSATVSSSLLTSTVSSILHSTTISFSSSLTTTSSILRTTTMSSSLSSMKVFSITPKTIMSSSLPKTTLSSSLPSMMVSSSLPSTTVSSSLPSTTMSSSLLSNSVSSSLSSRTVSSGLLTTTVSSSLLTMTVSSNLSLTTMSRTSSALGTSAFSTVTSPIKEIPAVLVTSSCAPPFLQTHLASRTQLTRTRHKFISIYSAAFLTTLTNTPALVSWISSRFATPSTVSYSSTASSLRTTKSILVAPTTAVSLPVSSSLRVYIPSKAVHSSVISRLTTSLKTSNMATKLNVHASTSTFPGSSSLSLSISSSSIIASLHSSVVPVWCPCTCKQAEMISSLTNNNKTTEQVTEELEEALTEMTVDSKATAINERKLASANDKRDSAKVVGTAGVAICTCIVIMIVLSDLALLIGAIKRVLTE